MKRFAGMVTALTAMLVLAACAGPAPSPEPAPRATATAAPAPGWEQQWNKQVAEAKKEGKVTIYALWRPEVRTAVAPAFRARHGIEVDFLPFGRGAELIARVEAEKRAGLVLADVLGAGGTTIISGLKPAGLMGPMETLLVLPEVKNPQNWQGGQFPWMDKGHMGVNMIAAVQRLIVRNKDLVREDEVRTYRDVLKPQFKGKITLNDPTVQGAGNSVLTHLAVDLWKPEEAYDFFRELMKQQPVIERDNRTNVESVARGKYAIALGTQADILANFLDMGAPIAPVIVKEGVRVSASTYSMAVPTVSASPNATAVFVNWILSREGQVVLSKSSRLPSMRVDVPTEGINPIYLPVPGEKLYPDSEEWQLTAGTKMMDIARKIIEESRR
ncbi:MAG: extracellular solute-binding protein [Chloroflexi bacterium]|nr:extracellular solute-binding protein [Chloroflexota bacterium]